MALGIKPKSSLRSTEPLVASLGSWCPMPGGSHYGPLRLCGDLGSVVGLCLASPRSARAAWPEQNEQGGQQQQTGSEVRRGFEGHCKRAGPGKPPGWTEAGPRTYAVSWKEVIARTWPDPQLKDLLGREETAVNGAALWVAPRQCSQTQDDKVASTGTPPASQGKGREACPPSQEQKARGASAKVGRLCENTRCSGNSWLSDKGECVGPREETGRKDRLGQAHDELLRWDKTSLGHGDVEGTFHWPRSDTPKAELRVATAGTRQTHRHREQTYGSRCPHCLSGWGSRCPHRLSGWGSWRLGIPAPNVNSSCSYLILRAPFALGGVLVWTQQFHGRLLSTWQSSFSPCAGAPSALEPPLCLHTPRCLPHLPSLWKQCRTRKLRLCWSEAVTSSRDHLEHSCTLASISELACIYLALILHNEVRVTEDKTTALVEEASVNADPFRPGLFAKALQVKVDIQSLICNSGAGRPAPSITSAPLRRRKGVGVPPRKHKQGLLNGLRQEAPHNAAWQELTTAMDQAGGRGSSR
ncbi:60S acidic ribosomal protein P1 [Camelus dromedarius]|uniref:Large ribosomal subunit protein P1 n=1 Tax=Camelus dromedarius TaxID=9838 RepID=A0A5N4DCZ4_CAMDR|nr:60S acidic ribosomal protein P1 [Camelus dromedarius]